MEIKSKEVSMAKGVAIILMVLAHTDFSDFGERIIYMFHMPLFFFLSGYCFKTSYLNSFKSFAIKRIKGAYLPYVKWGIVFLLFHNLLLKLHIYDVEYGVNMYGLRDIVIKFIKILCSMTNADPLLGGYWFLHSYFVASFIFFLIVYISRNNIYKMIVGGALLMILCLFSSVSKISIPGYIGYREIFATLFMVAGHIYKESGFNFENKPKIVLPVTLLIVIVGALLWPGNMLSILPYRIIPYCLSAIAGSIMVMSFCHLLLKSAYVETIFTYLGNRTLSILTWHFLSFKVVSLLIILLYGLSIHRLGEFPIIQEYSKDGWWIVYTMFGISFPLTKDALMYLGRRSKHCEVSSL